MDRNVWIAAALGAVLMCVGMVVGAGFSGSGDDQPAPALPPDLLEVPLEEPASRTAGPHLGTDLGPQVLQRLARVEALVEELKAEQAKMARGVEPAAELVAFFKNKIPSMSRARAGANQTAAIATSRNVISAQAQLQATGRIDTDSDGVGEYGGFREMSGAVPGRMTKALVPPVLSSAFRKLNDYGEAVRNGYLYRFYLPSSTGEGIGEPQGGFTAASGVDADLAETTWCVYAWPVDAKAQGGRVYFTNQMGDVLSTEDARYSGPGNGPLPDSAFTSRKTITGAAAIGKQAQDGNVWKQVN